MPEFKIIQEHIERRTYLKGKFQGKFIGFLDVQKSDGKHENYFDIEVLSGHIHVNRKDFRIWKEGDEFEEYLDVEKFLTKLPDKLALSIQHSAGEVKNYKIQLNEPKLSNYNLLKQQHDGQRVFGDIVGDISGYIKHYDVEEKKVEINDESNSGSDEKPSEFEKGYAVTRTTRQTGNTEVKGNYKRWEYYNSDGTTSWGEYIYQGSGDRISFWGVLTGLIHALFVLFLLFSIISIGWSFLWPILVFGLVIWLLSVLGPFIRLLFNAIFRLISIGFLVFLILGIIQLLIKSPEIKPSEDRLADEPTEITVSKTDVENVNDSIISHHRLWNDYSGNKFEADLEIRASDFYKARKFRNNISQSMDITFGYNRIVSQIHDFDRSLLPRVYTMLDSIRAGANLTDVQFAEVITACIQDIPYTLILDNDCNSKLYDDAFIQEYLSDGGKCEGNVKFGLYSPSEFIGTLKGDCDTRTLLLFTIFNHYRYDVVMLGSELYRHSIIGINLPIPGLSKTVEGRRFVVWETTQRDIPPGVLPAEISNMRFWSVNLISNNQSI